jgi:selenide,water dikinase
VYRLDEATALVQTVDFFTPIVDDPYEFGSIAAANALSDVYAMGGTPISALAIAAMPGHDFPAEDIRAIFRGGLDTLQQAGVALLGGHTVRDEEVKFGYAVTGVVRPGQQWTNAGARPGDVLILTKPLGTGIIATAIKHDAAPPDVVTGAVTAMRALNRAAADVLRRVAAGGVHACTDITGFGLIGHASEVAAASGVVLVFEAGALPVLAGALELSERFRPGGLASNAAHFGAAVRRPAGLSPARDAVLCDPQTSGGLLVAVDPSAAAGVLDALRAAGVAAVAVGVAREKGPGDPLLVELT